MTNSTCTDATLTGAWYSRMVVKHYDCHSTAPADINRLDTGRYAPECLTGREQVKHIATLVITETKTLLCQ